MIVYLFESFFFVRCIVFTLQHEEMPSDWQEGTGQMMVHLIIDGAQGKSYNISINGQRTLLRVHLT